MTRHSLADRMAPLAVAVCGMRATAEASFALIYKGYLEENTLPISWSKTRW
jgi:hypothetical protein